MRKKDFCGQNPYICEIEEELGRKKATRLTRVASRFAQAVDAHLFLCTATFVANGPCSQTCSYILQEIFKTN